MPILNTIRAYPHDKLLTKDNPNDFTARTVSEYPLTVKQICEAAVTRSVLDSPAETFSNRKRSILLPFSRMRS